MDDVFGRMLELSRKGYFCAQILSSWRWTPRGRTARSSYARWAVSTRASVSPADLRRADRRACFLAYFSEGLDGRERDAMLRSSRLVPGAHGRIRRRELRPHPGGRPVQSARRCPALVQEVYGKCVELLEARGSADVQDIRKDKERLPVCLRTIDAEKAVAGDGFVHLIKTCPEHGFFDTLIWEGGADEYLAWGGAPAGGGADDGCPNNCGLCAGHKSEGCCVLLELTHRCNLRCPVCFASAGGEGDLGLDEIARLYDMLMARGGPFNIQLSGGEPTMRDDLPEVVRLGRERGFTFFQLNTNGLRLASEAGYAEELREAGVSCAFLQFDGLRPASYEALRGRDISAEKLRAIDNCAAAGLPVVLVPTLAPGVNEDEIGGILRFALARGKAVRGVHFQPVSYFGRCELPEPETRLTIPRVIREIEAQTGGAMKFADFGGGGAESPWCSFHASYRKLPGGGLKALPRRRAPAAAKRARGPRLRRRALNAEAGPPPRRTASTASCARRWRTPSPSPAWPSWTRTAWTSSGCAAATSARPTPSAAWCPSAPTTSRRGTGARCTGNEKDKA
ncbi:MAG: radical SAM protein [Oscillospiraceae bacterium]